MPTPLEQLDDTLRSRNIKYFTAAEICPRAVPHQMLWTNILPTLWFAEYLRELYGPTKVNSGYRDPQHNREVGGAKSSLHIAFNALDLRPENGDPHQWAAALREMRLHDFGGIGIYITKNFIHIDTRSLVLGRDPWYQVFP